MQVCWKISSLSRYVFNIKQVYSVLLAEDSVVSDFDLGNHQHSKTQIGICSHWCSLLHIQAVPYIQRACCRRPNKNAKMRSTAGCLGNDWQSRECITSALIFILILLLPLCRHLARILKWCSVRSCFFCFFFLISSISGSANHQQLH